MFEKVFSIFSKIMLKIFSKKCQKNLVYFESFHGKKYNDNPKAIYEYIKNNEKDFHCIWGVKKGYENIFIENNVPYVIRFSLKWFKIVAQANFWITNTRTKDWIVKSPYTKYIETWHGTPLKKIGLDINNAQIGNQSDIDYKHSVLQDTRQWDVITSVSPYTDRCFKNAFNLTDDQILSIGYPRNDLLLDKDRDNKIINIKEKLKLQNKHIILYAPTWRENNKDDNGYQFDIPFNFSKLKELLPDNWVLLVRMHYLVSDKLIISDNDKDQIINLSNYNDMAELLLISDVLITDYSSCFFDYALLNRPIVFYLHDRQEYEENLRGLYLTDLMNLLPGNIVEDEKSFYNLIIDITSNKLELDQSKYQQFNDYFNLYERANSSEKIVEWMENP